VDTLKQVAAKVRRDRSYGIGFEMSSMIGAES